MILMIDNYDSFTYNLVQYLGQLGGRGRSPERRDHPRGNRGDGARGDLSLAGPLLAEGGGDHRGGDPDISHSGSRSWGSAWDIRPSATPSAAEVVRADRLMHGKTSPIFNDGRTIFKGLPNPFTAGRYHSLLVERETLPRLPGGERGNGGRGDHGTSPPGIPRGGDPVPPRIGPDPERETNHWKFSGNGHREQERRGSMNHDQGSDCESRPGDRSAGSGNDGRS